MFGDDFGKIVRTVEIDQGGDVVLAGDDGGAAHSASLGDFASGMLCGR